MLKYVHVFRPSVSPHSLLHLFPLVFTLTYNFNIMHYVDEMCPILLNATASSRRFTVNHTVPVATDRTRAIGESLLHCLSY